MRTSREIAEKLFGEVSPEGWRVAVGHAVSEAKFSEIVQAFDSVREDGWEARREFELRMRGQLAELLNAINQERASLLGAVSQAKHHFDNIEGRFAARVLAMLKVLEDEVQTAAGARHR